MDGNYELLISKINEFTQKFYLNKLLRGLIFTFALLLSLYLILFVLMYYFQPGAVIKTLLFFSYILLLIISAVTGIIKPSLAYFRVIKTLSTEESARLIGNHFHEVSDKLLNTLQLKELADCSPQHRALILAGIDQKINDLKPIPFSNAIQLTENRKYIKYFLTPLLLILAIGMIAPVVLKEGTYSFIWYNKQILPPPPFEFKLRNTSLTVLQGDDLNLDLELIGDQLPQEVYIQEGPNTFKFENDHHNRFHFTFKNIQKNRIFRLNAGGFDTAPYQITVKARPEVLELRADLVYPAYLHKEKEHIQNAGDLFVPEGTVIKWTITTANTDRLLFMLGDKANPLIIQHNQSAFSTRALKSTSYSISPANHFAGLNDSVGHQLAVIADLPPAIDVVEKADSISNKAFYFIGKITDDHGFSALRFVYSVSVNGIPKRKVITSIPVKTTQTEFSFFHFLGLKNIALRQGEVLEYFFEVADNDAPNGFKRSRTPAKTYLMPNDQQIAKQENSNSNALKQKMDAAIELAATVEKESKKIGQQLLDKKNISFEDKKDITRLLDKQKKLESAIQDIKKIKEKNTAEQEENATIKNQLAEKQKQIDDLFNNVLNPETKSLLEKLQSLMEQNNKDQMQNELSKMNMDNKSLKNELDRILELYKQLEFEQNLQNKIERLSKLAKTQKELANTTQSKKTDTEELKKQQQLVITDFKGIKKELKELEEKNQLLERPNPFQNKDKETKQIDDQLQSIEQQLNEKNTKKAVPLQEKAADQLENLSKKLEEAQQQSEEMESNLNAEELRQLLKQLLYSSFEQEKLMLKFKQMNSGDPAYLTGIQQQQIQKANMKTIADSLRVLSKRVPQIESTVTDELQKINFNMDKSLENLADRHLPEALKNQQYTMTSINNLALMLNEALDKMEKNKKNGKGGSKSSKKSMQQLQQLQQQLNKNMQEAKNKLQQSGNKGTVPKGQLSEEFAKMAQQQQMIREALQKINSEQNKDGKGSLGNLNQLVKDMKLTEGDLVNKRLEQETLNRQKNLLTKLLDADKAEREQNEDGKRESQAAKDFPPSYPKILEQFRKKQTTESEFLQKLPPALNYYYKNKIADYFKLLNLQ